MNKEKYHSFIFETKNVSDFCLWCNMYRVRHSNFPPSTTELCSWGGTVWVPRPVSKHFWPQIWRKGDFFALYGEVLLNYYFRELVFAWIFQSESIFKMNKTDWNIYLKLERFIEDRIERFPVDFSLIFSFSFW